MSNSTASFIARLILTIVFIGIMNVVDRVAGEETSTNVVVGLSMIISFLVFPSKPVEK